MANKFQKILYSFVLAVLTSFGSAFAATYYVDNNLGSDLNNGLSSGSPWQNLTKVNSFVFSPMDSILFVRGGVWRGQLIARSGSALGHITYSDYGMGAKPLILGSVNKSATSDWIDEGENIWRCSITFSTDIGNLIFNDATLFGIKKWNQLNLLIQGDYWYDLSNGTLKIFSSSNPASFYSDIECALRSHIVLHQNVSYATFNNLSLKYGAAHGFGGGNTQNLIIRACDLSYIGGGDLNMDGSNIRFGNGIEFWGNAHDNIVEQCKIWEIYDTGLTNQNQGSTVEQYNIYYRNNILFNCALASYEYWNKPISSTTANIHFENNTCANAGYGWGTQRPDRVGVHILLSRNEAATDSIFIRNNVFYKANACLAIPSTWNTTDGYQNMILSNNCYYQPSPTDTIVFLFFSQAYNSSAFSTYQTNTGHDINSFISDPLFVNYAANDYHIVSNSPLIDQGYPTAIPNDFDNEGRVFPIDVGADEFYVNTSAIDDKLIHQSLSVSPNPAAKTLTINLTGKSGTEQIHIVNSCGMLLKEFEINGTTQINVDDLPMGLYFIQFNTHSRQTIRFIKL